MWADEKGDHLPSLVGATVSFGEIIYLRLRRRRLSQKPIVDDVFGRKTLLK